MSEKGPAREPSGRSGAESNGWPVGRFYLKKEAHSVAADRSEGVGLRTKSEEVLNSALPLSYAPKVGGIRTRDSCI
jgi:hypothetical protein